MSKTFSTAAVIILTAVVAAGAVYWLKPSKNVNVHVTVEQMRNIAELATTEWTLSAFAEDEFKSQGIKKFTSDYVIAYVRGKVRGSVDLSKAKIEQSADNRSVTITFPPDSILVSGVEVDPYDPDAFKTISCAAKLPSAAGHPATPGQTEGLRKIAIQKIRDAALKTGIVEKTRQNAINVLSEFLKNLGYTTKVEFEEPVYSPSSPTSGKLTK